MLSLSEIISDNREILKQSTVGQQFAMHALSRDADGLLTNSKVMWNSTDSVDLTTGEGFAYKGIEELLSGTTADGTEINDVAVAPNSGISNDPIVIKVTVEGVFSTTPFFVLNGQTSPDLNLMRGHTYLFDVSDSTTESFPIFISTAGAGGTYNNEYLSGVTHSRAAFGGTDDPYTATASNLLFTVPWDAPDQLFYASGNINTPNMIGNIFVQHGDTDLNARKYEQVRFDHQKLYYYINDRGFLVARYGSDYSYTGPA